MIGIRDIELISTYLDGHLRPSESAHLESRLKSDPEFARACEDLRFARSVLGKLPPRKAPRNFRLTRQMVAARPPMPRSYSFFRYSSAFATGLLLITFAFNLLGSRISFGAAAPAPEIGYGGGPGSGGDCGEPCGLDPSLQAPSAVTEAPAATQAPLMELQILPTQTPLASADAARVMETPTLMTAMQKEGENEPGMQNQPEAPTEAVKILSNWELGLLIAALLSAAMTFLINWSAKRKWS